MHHFNPEEAKDYQDDTSSDSDEPVAKGASKSKTKIKNKKKKKKGKSSTKHSLSKTGLSFGMPKPTLAELEKAK